MHTAIAVAKLLYVPAIVWGIWWMLFDSWMQVLPLYHKDPHLALQRWMGALLVPDSSLPYADSFLFLFVLAFPWLILCWPNDVNRRSALYNGVCVWILFFPVPLVLLLLFKPSLAGPIGEMIGATFSLIF